MSSRNKNTAYFNDDFEVTYEDDMFFDYHTDDTSEIEFETQELRSAGRNRKYAHSAGNAAAYDTADEDLVYSDPYRAKKSRRKYRPTQLAAPIQKGGSAVFHIGRTVIRNLTLFLMLAILILMGYNFLRGSIPYGDIQEAVAANTYTMTLAAYFSVAAALMFYEIISILWAMTRVRVRDEYGTHREDVGRGMFSFLFLYFCSFAAFYISSWIPESMELLIGLKGALDVFGSMHNVLFGFCLAGVISCLFRKYSITL